MSKTKTQTTIKTTKAKQARQALARVPDQLAELETMSIGQLRERYRELFNEASTSRNKAYLRKKLQARVQELAEGGSSEAAKERVKELNKTTPVRRRFGKSGPTSANAKGKGNSTAAEDAANDDAANDDMTADRDPRLPPPGTVLRKVHNDVAHQVKVLASGFEYKGQHYKSLSKVARLITGTIWNGYGYFAAELRAAGGGEA
jgi:hypothetical protein